MNVQNNDFFRALNEQSSQTPRAPWHADTQDEEPKPEPQTLASKMFPKEARGLIFGLIGLFGLVVIALLAAIVSDSVISYRIKSQKDADRAAAAAQPAPTTAVNMAASAPLTMPASLMPALTANPAAMEKLRKDLKSATAPAPAPLTVVATPVSPGKTDAQAQPDASAQKEPAKVAALTPLAPLPNATVDAKPVDVKPADVKPANANPSPAPAAKTISDSTLNMVMHAASLIREGQISSARLLLQQASQSGDAQVYFALAETYDPLSLQRWNAIGISGDKAKALELYQKAEDAGSPDAADRISALKK